MDEEIIDAEAFASAAAQVERLWRTRLVAFVAEDEFPDEHPIRHGESPTVADMAQWLLGQNPIRDSEVFRLSATSVDAADVELAIALREPLYQQSRVIGNLREMSGQVLKFMIGSDLGVETPSGTVIWAVTDDEPDWDEIRGELGINSNASPFDELKRRYRTRKRGLQDVGYSGEAPPAILNHLALDPLAHDVAKRWEHWTRVLGLSEQPTVGEVAWFLRKLYASPSATRRVLDPMDARTVQAEIALTTWRTVSSASDRIAELASKAGQVVKAMIGQHLGIETASGSRATWAERTDRIDWRTVIRHSGCATDNQLADLERRCRSVTRKLHEDPRVCRAPSPTDATVS